ncbi:DNA-binding response regulator, NarL/FixJ family, contains REC and HTH domains [Tessaracoccus oleiagri]|uniref:DNA-binding response regulator, NarL/FixJ family, contains REC and HTH domains n=2 Tax=Tessaracoccus oleiagri TaxID=686624 RepID=A0A1G9N1E9_9ACTN|nr:DNA-binding response regulator, NarL/FixJ family, contains REC and HTH domains [Tessaracoccus oleiagri]
MGPIVAGDERHGKRFTNNVNIGRLMRGDPSPSRVSTMPGPIRVLLVDDDAVLLLQLRRRLDRMPGIRCVGVADSGCAAIEKARTLLPDVVLMDIRMPGMDGVTATRTLMAEPRPPKVVAVTALGDDDTFNAAVRAGAVGFILKTASAEELSKAIHKAVAGYNPLDERLISLLLASYQRQLRFEVPALSPKQQELLRHVGQGMRNSEIAERMHLSEATVRTYVSRLLQATGCESRAQLVAFAYRSGLAFD